MNVIKVLLLTDEVWNDSIHANNVLSNWFNGFDAQFANIYCSAGIPDNKCCRKYFQITDKMMINSILHKTKAGLILYQEDLKKRNAVNSSKSNRVTAFMKKYFGNILRFCKSYVWIHGKYNTDELSKFICEFTPDIIFSPRFATTKMLRLEKIVYETAKCPMIAFTGDNEYSLRKFILSPIGWFNEIQRRWALKRMLPYYSLYYTLSDEQKNEYNKFFMCPVKILRKCCDKNELNIKQTVNNPIKMIYAGKLYCGRWKVLAGIGKNLRRINAHEVKITLDIYTKDILTKRQRRLLNDGRNIFFRGAVSQSELDKIYADGDIALHIEAFDIINRLETRVSFSTKIIDCLSSGCAVMAVAWKEHSGLTYLKREDAAICVDSLSNLPDAIDNLARDPGIIVEYRAKAAECVKKNHMKDNVQKIIHDDFENIINKYKNK